MKATKKTVNVPARVNGKKPVQVRSKAQVPVAVLEREGTLPVGVGMNMQSLMERAIDKMVPIDYLQKLIDLIQAQRDRWAKERFHEDLAKAQAEFPVVEKLGQARNTDKSCLPCKGQGVVNGKPCDACDGTGHPLLYLYVRYEDLVEKAGSVAAKWGFSATTRAKPYKDELLGLIMMRATCVLRHRDGHTEETTIDVPIGEGTKLMSPMQKYMGAKTFAKRHAYKDALGIAERGEDVEGPEENSDRSPITEPRATTKATPAAHTDPAVPVQHEETAKPRTFLDTVQHYLMATEADPKSKLRVALFTENERIDYMHNAREASGNIEEEKIVLDDIIATGKKRRAAIKGE